LPSCAPDGKGTGTTGGKVVHQQGPALPSCIAQPKPAPHREQMLGVPVLMWSPSVNDDAALIL
jgi:hypothetical protein